jgi:hypothetical protein
LSKGKLTPERRDWLWDRDLLKRPGEPAAHACWVLGALVSFDVALAHGNSFALVFGSGLLLTLFFGSVAGLVTIGSDQRRIKQWMKDHPEPGRVKRKKNQRS